MYVVKSRRYFVVSTILVVLLVPNQEAFSNTEQLSSLNVKTNLLISQDYEEEVIIEETEPEETYEEN